MKENQGKEGKGAGGELSPEAASFKMSRSADL